MATYRVHTNKNYTVMSNTHLRDKSMSLKAKGLLSVMLSLPDTWDYSINGLVAICKENNTAVESALKELKTLGYLIVTKKMPNETKSGRIEYEYDIYESPQEAARLIAEKQRVEKQGVENLWVEKQGVENLWVEKQGVENEGQLNTKELNTKKLNTKESNKEIYADIIDFLNEKAGTKFKPTSKTTQSHIHARLEEGFTLEDFKVVIAKKCDEWIGTDFAQYLRPSTLFGSKFESYLNAPAKERKTYGTTGIQIKQPEEEDELAGIL